MQYKVGWRMSVVILLAYGVLAVLLTYPLVMTIFTHVPGADGDPSAYIWAFWWAKRSLLSPDSSAFYSNFILYPVGADLVLNASVWLKAYLFIPLQRAFGLVFTYNFSLLFALTVSAFGMFHLGFFLTENRLAAILMGFFYGFSPFLMMRLNGHLNYMSAEWLPFYVLYLHKTLRDQKIQSWLLAGLFLACVAYTEYTYLIYMIILTLCTFLFYYLKMSLLRCPAKGVVAITFLIRDWPSLLKKGMLIAATFIGFFCLLLVPLVRFIARGSGRLPAGWYGADVYCADLLSYISPSPFSTFLGKWSLVEKFTGNGVESTTYLGLFLLGLFILTWLCPTRRYEIVRLYSFIALAFFVLSLGPKLHVLGQDTINLYGYNFSLALPFRLTAWLPLHGHIRAPGRFAIVVTLSVVIVAGFGLSQVFARYSSRRYVLAALVLIVATIEYLSVPLSVQKLTIESHLLEEIAQDPAAVTVLQLPFGIRSGLDSYGDEHSMQLYFQTIFRKKVMGGFVSRIDPAIMEYFRQMPVLATLVRIQRGEAIAEQEKNADKALIEDFIKNLTLKYVILYKPWLRPGSLREYDEYIQRTLPVQRRQEDTSFVVYTLDLLGASLPETPRLAVRALSTLFPSALGERGMHSTLELVSHPRLAVLPAKSQTTMTVKVTNQASAAALPRFTKPGYYAVALGYRWYSETDEVDVTGGLAYEQYRSLLPLPLLPGQSVHIPINVYPPPLPGVYTLRMRMVQEGVAWFPCQLQGNCLDLRVRVE